MRHEFIVSVEVPDDVPAPTVLSALEDVVNNTENVPAVERFDGVTVSRATPGGTADLIEGRTRAHLPESKCSRYSADPEVQPTCFARSKMIEAYCPRCLAYYHFTSLAALLRRLDAQVPGPPTIDVKDFNVPKDYKVKPINRDNLGTLDVTNL